MHAHGRYSRIELVACYDKKYGSFYIYRYLCATSGKTISMHPDFCVAYKRYLLEHVITLLEQYLFNETSLYSVCREHHVYNRTLKRWRKGFLANETAKRICFLPHSTAPPGLEFLKELFTFFVISGNGIAAQGAASGLVRLYHTFSSSLY